MRILALILARGGSKRLPGKNIRHLGGKPLIGWSIDIGKLINLQFKIKKVETDYMDYSLTNIEKEVQRGVYFDEVKSMKIQINGNKDILLTKEYIKKNSSEIKILLSKIGNHYEETKVKNGKGKYHKLVEKKKIKK